MATAEAVSPSSPRPASRDVLPLIKAPASELEAKMRAGVAPSFESIVGWEFAGTNTGAMTDLLGIRKFKKGFFRPTTPRAGAGPDPFVEGYNVVVAQNGIGAPHVAVPNEASPKRHGFYRVHKVVSGAKDDEYPNALLLDYGLGKNGLNPAGLLRDYLVQIDANDPDLLLGKAYFALLGMRIPAGYFVLVRNNRHEFGG